jgi:two-component system, OmpR family, alkaline phosphatase synthesis response regulator PhoP
MTISTDRTSKILVVEHDAPARNLVFGELAINLISREVRLKDKTLPLTPLEFQLLHFLAIHSGQAWSRQQLIEKVWDWKCNDARDEQVVDVYISLIRRKMAKVDSAVPNFIQTARGCGYIFNPSDRDRMVIAN